MRRPARQRRDGSKVRNERRFWAWAQLNRVREPHGGSATARTSGNIRTCCVLVRLHDRLDADHSGLHHLPACPSAGACASGRSGFERTLEQSYTVPARSASEGIWGGEVPIPQTGRSIEVSTSDKEKDDQD